MKKIAVLIALVISTVSLSQQCSITATDASGNTTVNYSCGIGGSISLKSDEPKVYQTDSYQVQKQAYDSTLIYNSGAELNLVRNNQYSGIIDLPFGFCFYGSTYNKIIISNNGFISFDTTLANQASNPYTDPGWTLASLSPYLPNNAIFGVKQALDYSKGGKIYYNVTGTAPCRSFVISFYKVSLLNCTETSTSQIVLHEFTNEIDINIAEKPACSTAIFKMSVAGIINADRSKSLAPTDRDTGEWTAMEESWKFRPNGNLIKPAIIWKNSAGQIISRNNPFSLYPIATDTYNATLTYNICSTNYQFSDDILVNYKPGGSAPTTPSDVQDIPRTLCDNNADGKETDPQIFDEITQKLRSDPSLTVTYHPSQAEADTGSNPVNYVQNGSYTLYARLTTSTGCYTTAKVMMNITFYDKIEAKDITKIYCFDGTSDFLGEDLLPYTDEMLISSPSDVSKRLIYSTPYNYDDAVEGDPSKSQTTVDITDDLASNNYMLSKEYFVRFENSQGCYTIKKLTIKLYNPKVLRNDIEICKNDNNANKNLHDYDATIAPYPIKITYFDPADPAKTIDNYTFSDPVTPVKAELTIPDAVKGDCVRSVTIKYYLNQPPVLKNTAPLNLDLRDKVCDNNNNGIELYSLSQYESYFYENAAAAGVTFAYYENYNPVNQTFSSPVNADYPLLKRQDSYHIYVQISSSKGCFSVGEIFIKNKFLPAIILQPGLLRECKPKALNQDVNFKLRKSIPDMFDKTNIIPLDHINVSFYLSEIDANEHPNKKIPNDEIEPRSPVSNVWARFEDKNHHCYSVAKLTLVIEVPLVPISPMPITLCDSNLDGKSDINLYDYTNLMTNPVDSDLSNIFSFYDSPADLSANKPIPNPRNYEPDVLPKTILVRLESLPGCYDDKSNAKIELVAGNKTQINPGFKDKISVCDEGNDGKENIDLTQYENAIAPGAAFSYYRSMQDLNKNEKEITTDKSNYPYIKSDDANIYVKVTAAGFCPSLVILPVDLRKVPEFKLNPYFFCPGTGTDISLKDVPDVGKIIDHVWKFPDGSTSKKETITAKDPGSYALTITTDNLCSYTDNFDVSAYEVPVIQQLVPIGTNGYKVIATGGEKILYSVDNVNFQESNIFETITPGVVTFYVKFESRECRGVTKKALSVKLPNVISPNGDGSNDRWILRGLDAYDSASRLKIFDKNGVKIWDKTSNQELIWDGKLDGRPLSTSTYWYQITFPDKEFTGWILLKNR